MEPASLTMGLLGAGFAGSMLVQLNLGAFAIMMPIVRNYRKNYSNAYQAFENLNEIRKNSFPTAYYLTYPAKILTEKIYF